MSRARASAVRKELAERGPTPETAARIRQDQVSVLLGRGLIDMRQQNAADEIREMFGALSSLYFRSGGYSRVDGQRRTAFHHLDGLPLPILQRYLPRYLPWTKWAHQQRSDGKSYLEWTFIAIIDNDPEYPPAPVVDSLEAYADLMEGKRT